MYRIFTLLALLASAGLSAQSGEQIDSIILGGLPLQIIVEDATSTPIVAQQYSYVGLDRMTGDSLWSVERKALSGLTQKLSEDNDDIVDLVDIPGVPYVFANGVIVDVRDGKKLVDESEEVKLFRGSHVVGDLNLVEVSVKGGTRLYGLGATDGSRRFAIDLKDKGGLGLNGNASGEGNRKPQPMDADNLFYFDNKNVYFINTKTGKLNWSYDGKVKELRSVNDGKHFALLYQPGGLLSLADYDKEFQLLDAATGAPVYKKPLKLDGNIKDIVPHEGGLAILHSGGMNVYDFGAEKGRWKKDFRQGGIKEFKMEDGGMMVYFKNKRMLLDPKTGEEQMKKAEKLDREPYTGPAPRAVFTFAGKEIKMWGSNSIEVDGGKKYFGRIAFDEASGLIAMAKPVEEGTNLKKGIYNYTISTYNVKTGASGSVNKVMVQSGIDHLTVSEKAIAAVSNNGRWAQVFPLDGSLPSAGEARNLGEMKRKGKGLARMMGGKEETPESIPSYLSGDSDFYRAARTEGFNAAEYKADPARVMALLGRHALIEGMKGDATFIMIIDKKTGEVLRDDLVFYNNANVTVDPKQDIVYVLQGNGIRWYKF